MRTFLAVSLFALMSFLAAVAGVVWMAQNQGSTKNGGKYYELYAIAAAIIGGTSLLGNEARSSAHSLADS